MHVLAVNSVSTLLNYLKEQLANTPTLEEIQTWNKEPERPPTPPEAEQANKPHDPTLGPPPVMPAHEEVKEEEEEEPPKIPLYLSEFILEPSHILFSPDEDEFQDGLAEVIKGFQDTVLQVQNLVPDTYFDAFTRYALSPHSNHSNSNMYIFSHPTVVSN